jgi:hypothetical protein
MTRREAFRNFSLFLAGSPLMPAQAVHGAGTEPKLEDLINVFDFDPVCKSKLSKAAGNFLTSNSPPAS